MRRPILVLLHLLAFSPFAWSQSSNPAPVKDGKFIDALIGQLGSSKFEERASAQKQLELIGVPALESLKKAKQNGDLELSKRAGELVRKIEEREFNAALLVPKRVRLQLADVPVAEAVAELAKASGYAMQLEGLDALANKKVALDTGDVTFLEALDKLCNQVGLMVIQIPRTRNRVAYGSEPPALILIPRTPEKGHLNYAGSVRFRLFVLPKENSPDYRMMIEAAGEPRLDGFKLVGAPTIKSCLDEQGRDMIFNKQAKLEITAQYPTSDPKLASLLSAVDDLLQQRQQFGVLHVKPGARLAELRGSYTAQVKTPVEVLTVEKVLESIGKSFKGKHGEDICVEEIQAAGPGSYTSLFTWTFPLRPFGEEKTPPDMDGDLVPELFDGKGNKWGRLPGQGGIRMAKGKVIQTANVIFQADAGQGEPARLVVNDLRTTHIDIPFMFQKVPLE
jgi:hypothetical protein